MVEKISLTDRLEILTQQIVRVKIYYDLWWFAHGPITGPSIEDTLNDFPTFFLFDKHAHFIGMLVHSAVVWDDGKKKISLPNISDEILDTKRFPEHSALKREIDDLESHAKGLVVIRNNAIAHRSAYDNYEIVIKSAGVSLDDLPIMINSWLEAVNKLRALIKPPLREMEFNPLPLGQLQDLIGRLGGPNLRPPSALDEILRD